MNRESLLEAQKIAIEQFPEKVTNKLDGREIAYNMCRFLQNYDEHLRALMEYEKSKKELLLRRENGINKKTI
jgi:hypothetical protein